MPKMPGYKERRHAAYYDTLIRADTNTAPSPTVQSTTNLFNGTNLGLEYWTNMKVAGVLPSDETFVVLALRVMLLFTGNNALIQYQLTVGSLYLTLQTSDKPQFAGPAWMFPAGGGIYGCDSATPAMVNGMPTAEAILKFAKPIPVPARQNFTVIANCYDFTTTSLRQSYLNASTTIGIRYIQVYLDGIHTRDVL